MFMSPLESVDPQMDPCSLIAYKLKPREIIHNRRMETTPTFGFEALIDGETVRASAARAGIHKNTAFRWCHRFLAVPAVMQAPRPGRNRRGR